MSGMQAGRDSSMSGLTHDDSGFGPGCEEVRRFPHLHPDDGMSDGCMQFFGWILFRSQVTGYGKNE